MVFRLSRPDATLQSSVSYHTVAGSAQPNSDYVHTSGTVVFAPGVYEKFITVQVKGDMIPEPQESFVIELSNPVNATIGNGQATGTIFDNDRQPVIRVGNLGRTASGGAPSFGFTVFLSEAAAEAVTVDYTTLDGTAAAGTDYTPASGSITFEPGETSKVVTVAGTASFAVDKWFFVNLANAGNATLLEDQAYGILKDNDEPLPEISVHNSSALEGDDGSGEMVFTVQLNEATDQVVTVDYATLDGSAASSTDYSAVGGTLIFNPGETIKRVSVSLVGDLAEETDESFALNLSNATNASISVAQASGTIVNDDTPPTISINNVGTVEGNSGTTELTFTVSLSHAGADTITVDYASADGSASGMDYVSTYGNLTFLPGQTTSSISVAVVGDTDFESDEWFFLDLSNAVGATIIESQGQATISNDDTLELPNSPPVAQGDSAVTVMNMPVTINVLANDSDPDEDPLTVISAGPATVGTVVINADNTVTYTPLAGYEGYDGFSYSISDGRGGTMGALVSITVGQPLLLDGEVGPGASHLTLEILQPVIVEAIAILFWAGFDVSALADTTFTITDLHSNLLGVAHEKTIWIDQDAAGHGWHVGRTLSLAERPAANRVDLLTVVTHELGHVLGFPSIDPEIDNDDWMTATLPLGTRRLPRRSGDLALLRLLESPAFMDFSDHFLESYIRTNERDNSLTISNRSTLVHDLHLYVLYGLEIGVRPRWRR